VFYSFICHAVEKCFLTGFLNLVAFACYQLELKMGENPFSNPFLGFWWHYCLKE